MAVFSFFLPFTFLFLLNQTFLFRAGYFSPLPFLVFFAPSSFLLRTALFSFSYCFQSLTILLPWLSRAICPPFLFPLLFSSLFLLHPLYFVEVNTRFLFPISRSYSTVQFLPPICYLSFLFLSVACFSSSRILESVATATLQMAPGASAGRFEMRFLKRSATTTGPRYYVVTQYCGERRWKRYYTTYNKTLGIN